jgi:hypothetical protein
LDEFNDHTDKRCEEFGIVGLIGPVHEWHKLQAKWEDALDCCGVGAFHATDLQGLEKEYKGWTESQRQRLIGLLVRIVQESMAGFRLLASATWLPAYRNLPNYRRRLIRTPYYLCAVAVMSDGARFARYHFGGQPVEFVFDQKTKHKHLLSDAYDEVLQTSHGDLCAAFSQADHRMISPIQVADLMAYESARFLHAAIRKEVPPETLRWPMRQLENLFFGSESSWFNHHGLMLVTDFWGNYERTDKLLRPDRRLPNRVGV